ncbi:MAG: MarR family winged helix-turn-helix transcriptional regulator [Pseudomonadota bacterium]
MAENERERSERGQLSQRIREAAPGLFMDLYYPFHYKVGFTIEATIRGTGLTQHQAVILWILHAEPSEGVGLPRKVIERRVGEWFDVTSSAVTKALQGLAAPPLALVALADDPSSGRERRVRLTTAGRERLRAMRHRANDLVSRIIVDLSDEEIMTGMRFLERVSDIVNNWRDEDRVP